MAQSSTPRTHQTRNNTNSNAKRVSIEALNARLADGIDLALAIKQAHWNLKGPQFIGIHLMLDGFRAEISDLNDKVAERAVQLGGTALGTAQAWRDHPSCRLTRPVSTPSPTTSRR